jgi:hypothetical protein
MRSSREQLSLAYFSSYFCSKNIYSYKKKELKLMRTELQHTTKIQEKTERAFRELVYNSLLATRLNSLNALLQIQREKIGIGNLKILSPSNGSSKPVNESSELVANYIKEINEYVNEIEKILKKF